MQAQFFAKASKVCGYPEVAGEKHDIYGGRNTFSPHVFRVPVSISIIDG